MDGTIRLGYDASDVKRGVADTEQDMKRMAKRVQDVRLVDPGPMKGYGKTIQYHAQQNRIVLIDQAKVLSPDGNSTEGEKITYDTVKQIANAGRANGSKVTAPRPRIDMVIQPKKKAE